MLNYDMNIYLDLVIQNVTLLEQTRYKRKTKKRKQLSCNFFLTKLFSYFALYFVQTKFQEKTFYKREKLYSK